MLNRMYKVTAKRTNENGFCIQISFHTLTHCAPRLEEKQQNSTFWYNNLVICE
jgi:hypothetical protein